MAAKFHLAEDPLALHLLLQHLEGLIDIVVTDKNLHAAFLFDRAMMGAMAKNARATGADRHSPDADGTRRKNQRSIFENVPADWHLGCRLEERRLRYVPVFGQLFRQTQCLSDNLNGPAGDKEQ